jgi:type IV pilus assembly protein PilB
MIAQRLGEILVADNILTEEQLASAVRLQNGSDRSLGDLLVDCGYASPEDVAQGLSRQFGIPYYELDDAFRLEPEEVNLIPEAAARRFCLVPVRKGGGETMTVVMKDPLDLDALDTVRSLTGLEVHKAVSTEGRILRVIDNFYTEEAHIERNLQDIIQLENQALSELEAEGGLDPDVLMNMANDAPVVRFVNLLLMQAVRDGASDVHFEPGERSVTVRLRVDGVLREVTPPPTHLYPAVVTRLKILANMDIAERRLPLDGRFKFTFHEHNVDIRASSLPEVYGEKIVLRILDQNSIVVNLDELGFETETLQRFKRVLRAPHGIILLTGPTGSGKTTTLYSALNFLRNPGVNIQTVEDPVEYQIPGVNQMAVREKIGLDFVSALRSILRQDPDIIMIGEIRDVETARIAIRAALTGHLVLSTLHTNDATSAFSRLRDIGIEPYLISATVKLVISQRLVRRICPACQEDDTPSAEDLAVLTAECPEAADWNVQRGAGCSECNGSGYRGRTAVMEVLQMTDDLRELIQADAGDVQIRRQALEDGMEELTRNSLRKIHDGITTVDEVLRVWPLLTYK